MNNVSNLVQPIKSIRWPLTGLLAVQLLSGVMLTPANSFFAIYLNEVLSYPLRQVAQIIALGQVVGMVASLAGGAMSDRWGHKWGLVWGVGAMAVSTLLYVFHVPWLVVLLWSIGSVGLGFATLSSQGYLTLAAGASTLGLSSALYNWGYTIGGAIGALLAALILGQDNFRALGLMLVGLGLFNALLASFLPQLHPPASPQDATVSSRGYVDLIRRKRIFILGLLRFLPTCYYGVMTLLPLLIKQQSGSNAIVAGYVAASAIFASLTQLVAGQAADRWGVRRPTQLAFGAILLAIAGTIITAQSVWGLYLFGMVGVGAAWALSTLLPGLVTTAAEPEVHGRVFGMLHLLWIAAMICGTLLGGALLETSIWLPFAIVGALNIVALMLTVPFFRMTTSAADAG